MSDIRYPFLLGYLETAIIRKYGPEAFEIIHEAYAEEKAARERDEARRERENWQVGNTNTGVIR